MRQVSTVTPLMCNPDGVLKQGGKHLMSTQHLSVRREDGAYSNRQSKKKGGRRDEKDESVELGGGATDKKEH